jgi:hypothetical protein
MCDALGVPPPALGSVAWGVASESIPRLCDRFGHAAIIAEDERIVIKPIALSGIRLGEMSN